MIRVAAFASVLVLPVATGCTSEQSPTPPREMELIALRCLDDAAAHANYDLASEDRQHDHRATVLLLSNRFLDVVMIAASKPAPDGQYWRCEVAKGAGETLRIEYSLGSIEPTLVELSEETDKASPRLTTEEEYGDTVKAEEFVVAELLAKRAQKKSR